MKENIEYRKKVEDILVNVRVDIKEFLNRHNDEYVNNGELIENVRYWNREREQFCMGRIKRIYIKKSIFGAENVCLEMVDGTKKNLYTCEIFDICGIADNLNQIAKIEEIENEDERIDAIGEMKRNFFKTN